MRRSNLVAGGTRALGGHFLSWFYTFEWPILGLIALAGWWHLIHEDPEKYRARKAGLDDWFLDENERAAAVEAGTEMTEPGHSFGRGPPSRRTGKACP